MAAIASSTRLENILECTVCFDRLKPPTYSCLSGHNVCSTCATHKPKCPQCGQQFSTQNNATLDQIIERTQFPCIYEEIGCRRTLMYRDILRHEEKECQFRMVRCILGKPGMKCNEPLLRCLWKQHIGKCRHGEYVQDITLGVETRKTAAVTPHVSFTQTVLRSGDLYFVETVICSPEVKSFLICYHYVGAVAQCRKFMYTVQIDQGKIRNAWKFVNFCMPFLTVDYNIRKDKRTAMIDPTKFVDDSKTISYSFKIETAESYNKRTSNK